MDGFFRKLKRNGNFNVLSMLVKHELVCFVYIKQHTLNTIGKQLMKNIIGMTQAGSIPNIQHTNLHNYKGFF